MRKLLRTMATVAVSAALATLATVTVTGPTVTAAPATVTTVAATRPMTHPARTAPTPIAPQFSEDSLPPVMYLWARQGETSKRHGMLRRIGTVDGHRGCWTAVPADPTREALLLCPDGYTQYS
jgi:hypothetical protein